MAIMFKRILAALGSATVLAACATGPYYDNGYGYPTYSYGYGYGGYGTPYYDPFYVAPSVGLGYGYTYHDREYRRGDWDGQRHREWRGDGDRRQWAQRTDIPRTAPQANFEQDVANQGRDGRGWSRDGSHSGG